MLASVISYSALGIDGQLIHVEVDIRRGLPGIDIVGLPDNAVKEAKERVRVAIRNSGFAFPRDRILINLAPAGIRKEGASYDLPIAIGILIASNQISNRKYLPVMVIGELNLEGGVKPVKGVISAVISGLVNDIALFLVPGENLTEANAVKRGRVFGISSLREAFKWFSDFTKGKLPDTALKKSVSGKMIENETDKYGDFTDIRGQLRLKRAMEIAAAGFHHIMVFGPPGSGKTMSAFRLPTILPDLTEQESLIVTRIHSIAGLLPVYTGLIMHRPFRAPHHTASLEGIIGGGTIPRPGEVSLAHKGVLLLDEAPEFKKTLLQSLREPIEAGMVTVSRVGSSIKFPSEFQLVMTANACPCGNLGRDDAVCICSRSEIYRYWRKIGGALLDRIDIRVPVQPVSREIIFSERGEASGTIRERVKQAVEIQEKRYKQYKFNRNSRIPSGFMEYFCSLDSQSSMTLFRATKKLSLSSRAYHSVLKIARTIADLSNSERITEEHILEAVQHRRYGDSDFFWNFN